MTRKSAALVVAGLMTLGVVVVAVPSTADTHPVGDEPVTLTGQVQSTWQTNGVVWALEIADGTAYVGGSFTKVRPPGVAEGGSGEVARRNLAAFDVATGDLLPWDPVVTAPEAADITDTTCQAGVTEGTRTCDTVFEIRKSPDESKIYVGGQFNAIDGVGRDKIAAFDTATGALDRSFYPAIYGTVRALVVTDTTVYAGGAFTNTKDGARSRLVAYNRADGQILPWAPTADRDVLAMVMSPDQSRIVLGGMFDQVNDTRIHGLMAVDAVTGESMPWASTPIPKESETRESWVTDLVADGDTVYAGANGEGTFDGRIALEPSTGEIRWIDTCTGATWALAVIGDVLYSGSHAHNCSTMRGGFPESREGFSEGAARHYRLLAQTTPGDATQILHWFPTTNGGIQGALGPRAMATDGTNLWVGGEFTTVNNRAQQGLARFTTTAKDSASAKPRTPTAVAVNNAQPGQVTVHVAGTEDADNLTLRYELIRDNDTANPIPLGEADSKPWSYPSFTYVDTDLRPGTFHTYDVRAVDPNGTRSNRSATVSELVRLEPTVYSQAVLASKPTIYWRMNEAEGTVADNATWGTDGTYGSAVVLGQNGAPDIVPADPAASFNGSSNSILRSDERVVAPNQFSVEGWFSTTSRNGGKLVGFAGDTNSWGFSSNYDRHLYMNSSGQLLFGTVAAPEAGSGGSTTRVVIKTPAAYNDGEWHHFVATRGDVDMRIFVDGELVASGENPKFHRYEGRWVVGGGSLTNWSEAPRNSAFTGVMDDVSIYPFELTEDEAVYHHEIALNPGLFSP